jgi:hypothetical protein
LRPLGHGALRTDQGDRMRVAADDPAGHRAALDAGYVGVRLAPDGSVVYERPVTHGGCFPDSEDSVRAVGGVGALAAGREPTSTSMRRSVEPAHPRAKAPLDGPRTARACAHCLG